MTTFVLVPGAGGGAWYWSHPVELTDLLERYLGEIGRPAPAA